MPVLICAFLIVTGISKLKRDLFVLTVSVLLAHENLTLCVCVGGEKALQQRVQRHSTLYLIVRGHRGIALYTTRSFGSRGKSKKYSSTNHVLQGRSSSELLLVSCSDV